MADEIKIGNAFEAAAAMLYAAECVVEGVYISNAQVLCSAVDTLLADRGGLTGKRVYDLGCGFGTTSVVLAGFGPKEIIAVDASASQIDLLALVLFDTWDLDSFRDRLSLVPVRLQGPLLEYLRVMRHDFRSSVFQRRGGKFLDRRSSAFDIEPRRVAVWPIPDAVVGCHLLHWMVRERVAVHQKGGASPDDAKKRAMENSLWQLSSMLAPGGVIGLLGPKGPLEIDDDPEMERDLNAHYEHTAPIAVRFDGIVNEMLTAAGHPTMSASKPLYKRSQLKRQFAEVGLKLVRIAHCERSYYGDLFAKLETQLPMRLGSVPLGVDEKLTLGREARARLEKEATPDDLHAGMRHQAFTFLAIKE